jgi:hypothetical protein
MSVEESASKGSPTCQEAFASLREQMKLDPNVVESIEYEPLRDAEAPTYSVQDTPRVRTFLGERLEVFISMPEKSIGAIKADESVPDALRAWVDKAQQGGMSRLLRVQLATKKDVEVLLPLIRSVIQH